MSPTMKALGIDKLSIAERVRLVEEIWESIVAEGGPPPLTEAQRQDLQRRLAEYDASPKDLTWEEVKELLREMPRFDEETHCRRTGAPSIREREEIARRGQELFEQLSRTTFREDQKGLFVAIDTVSGSYELDPNDKAATFRLLARQPGARIWGARVGYMAADSFGGRWLPGAEA